MAALFTSDPHFGHENIIGYTGRPFADVVEMDEALVAAWNARVGDDDEVWVLGDFAMGRIADTLGIAGRLNGHKVLVTGNHDRCWPGNGAKAAGWEERYLDAGFAEVRHGVVRVDVVHRSGVLAGHFPYEGDSQGTDRYTGARPLDEGGWLLHGHVHDKWRQRRRMINVGVDAWAGAPVHEDEVAALLDAGPCHLAPRPWTASRPPGETGRGGT
ncbi:metallophosphoesterase [soil metagenome]